MSGQAVYADPISNPDMQRGRTLAAWWPNALMALYGAGWCFTIPIVGNLFVAELIAIVCLPFLGWNRTLARYSDLWLILAGYALILVGLVVADLANQTPIRDFLRGWANPIFAVVNLLFVVSVLRRRLGAFLYFLAATFFFKLIFGDAGYTLQYGYVGLSLTDVAQNTNIFKTRFVPFIIPVLMLAAFYAYRFGVLGSGIVYLGAAFAFIALDARSLSLALLASAAFLIMRQFGFRLSARNIALISVPALLCGQIFYIAYVNYALANNPTGHTAVQLNRLDNPYNPLELLAQGRSDWSIAEIVIGDRPLTGHGSWARDDSGHYSAILEERTGDYTGLYAYQGPETLIFTHSFLLSSWVWGGIIAFAGALCVLWAVLKLSLIALNLPGPYIAICALVSVFLLWDLFFSPLQVMRTIFPHFIGFLIVLAGTYRSPESLQSRPQADAKGIS